MSEGQDLRKRSNASRETSLAGGEQAATPSPGFWSQQLGTVYGKVAKSFFAYYAAAGAAGLVVALLFAVRCTAPWWACLVLAPSAAAYFPILAVFVSLTLTVLVTVLRTANSLEGALGNLVDAVTTPVVARLSSSAPSVSLPELRTKLREAADGVVKDEQRETSLQNVSPLRAPLRAAWRGGMRLLLRSVLSALFYAAETRFADALRTETNGTSGAGGDAGRLSVVSVTRILRGELLAAIAAPLKGAIQMYILAAIAVYLVLTVVPFLLFCR